MYLCKPKRKHFRMTEFTITGIRYNLGNFANIDDATAAAVEYVAGLKKGQKVLLVAEPENPVDPNAIAVYIDYERRGRIDREETSEIHPLLDEDHQCEAEIVRTDNHITAFITIPGAPDSHRKAKEHQRVLPESILGDNVKMPFTTEESNLQVIARNLLRMEVDSNNYRSFIQLAERYLPFLKLSICDDECFWMNRIAKKLNRVYSKRKELGMTDEEAEEALSLYNKVHAAVGDLHTVAEHWPQRIFIDHLDRLRNNHEVNHFLYEKYIETFLNHQDFAEADKAKLIAEYERLSGWLRNMKWSELRNPDDLQIMGFKVYYLGLSRQELYELYSVLLILEKLKEQLKGMILNQEEIVEQLKTMFYGDDQEARSFLQSIQGMKAVQITTMVNQLVAERKISDVSRKHQLWEVLYNNKLYKKTESNWNNQVK